MRLSPIFIFAVYSLLFSVDWRGRGRRLFWHKHFSVRPWENWWVRKYGLEPLTYTLSSIAAAAVANKSEMHCGSRIWSVLDKVGGAATQRALKNAKSWSEHMTLLKEPWLFSQEVRVILNNSESCILIRQNVFQCNNNLYIKWVDTG